MEELKQFLVDNWQILGAGCLAVLSFLFNLFKKRPSVDSVDGYLKYLNLFMIPELIQEAEEKETDGVQKKAYVTDRVLKAVQRKFYNLSKDDLRLIYKTISGMIETYLSTPQKKNSDTQVRI